jgi:PTH1 family peptidyl-tRNA hydrolase
MEAQGTRLIVGLGNPGREYSQTRHNAGFLVLDNLAARWGVPLSRRVFEASFGSGFASGVPVVLAKPQTFMNRSGAAVGRLSRFLRVKREDLFVIHDDIDLPFGLIKIKEKGGHGGHNGLKSIIHALGDGDFLRLRLGIGRGGPGTTRRTMFFPALMKENAACLRRFWTLRQRRLKPSSPPERRRQ